MVKKLEKKAKKIKVKMSKIEEILKKLNIDIPSPPKPVGNYAAFSKYEKLIYISGQLPIGADGKIITGKVIKDVSLEQLGFFTLISSSHVCVDMKSLSFRLRIFGLFYDVFVAKSGHAKGSKRTLIGKIGRSKHTFLSLSTSVIRFTSLSRAVVLKSV